MAQWVKDLALSLPWLWLLLWHGFDPLLENFHMTRVQPKKKKKKKKEKKKKKKKKEKKKKKLIYNELLIIQPVTLVQLHDLQASIQNENAVPLILKRKKKVQLQALKYKDFFFFKNVLLITIYIRIIVT